MTGRWTEPDPPHAHRVTVLECTSTVDGWRVTWGCRDCPMEMVGPVSVERLEDVECEAESERRVA